MVGSVGAELDIRGAARNGGKPWPRRTVCRIGRGLPGKSGGELRRMTNVEIPPAFFFVPVAI